MAHRPLREGQKKQGEYAGAYRIQVAISEENYRLLKARAERAGTTMSAIAGILIDAGLHAAFQPPCVSLDMFPAEGRRQLQQALEAERLEAERRGVRRR